MGRGIKAYFIDLFERTGATAAEAAIGSLILAGALDLTVLKGAALTGVMSGLAVLKGGIAKFIGNRNSASLAPSVPPPE